MDVEGQHKRAIDIYRKIEKNVERGRGESVTNPKLLAAFNSLAREVFDHGDGHMFMYCPSYASGSVTYQDLLQKVRQLKAITASRLGIERHRDIAEESGRIEPVAAFFSTLCAGAIVFFVSAHFAAVVPPAVQAMLGY